MSDKITEQLFSAVDTIVQKRLSALSYDKTILCTIINNTHKDKGEYVVNDGSTSFTAYSDNTYYQEGAQVYVNIPKGDYGNQKMIVGRYVSNSSESFNWISPMESYVPLTENLVGGNGFIIQNNSILANGKTLDEHQKPVLSKVIYPKTNLEKNDNYISFNRLGLSVDFKTNLKSLKTIAGSYGILITLHCLKEVGSGQPPKKEELILQIDSKDMVGNPYAYDSFFTQEKVYEIKDIGRIEAIEASLYQGDNFINADGAPIPYSSVNMEEGSEELLPDNIFIDRIQISLGYGLDDIKDEQAYIYTLAPMTYKAQSAATINDNIKTIGLRWIAQRNGQYIAINSADDINLPKEYEIFWYHKVLRAGVSSEYGGPLWEELTDYKNKFNCDFIPDGKLPKEEIKVVIRYLADEAGRDAAAGSNVNLDKFYKLLRSNILTFTNENDVELQNLDLINALKISIPGDEVYKGIYRIYNPDTGYLLNSRESYKKRVLQATYNSLITADSLLDGAESIDWYIPKKNTMIQVPTEGTEYDTEKGDVFTEDEEFYHIQRVVPKAEQTEPGNAERSTQQIYKIKNYYTPDYTNNTIQCVLTRNGLVYSASITLAFGPAGAMGSDYSIAIHLTDIVELDADGNEKIVESNIGAIPSTLKDTQWVKVYAELFDCNGRYIPDAQFDWEWYEPFKNMSHKLIIKDVQNGVISGTKCYLQWDNWFTQAERFNVQDILQISAKVKDGQQSRRLIYNYYSVPSKRDSSISYLEGAINIVYDSTGARPTYYKNPYRLYDRDDALINNTNCEVYHTGGDDSALVTNFAPKIVERDGSQFLKPCNMYVNDLDVIYYISIGGQVNIGGTITYATLWSQPLYITQNRYPSTMLTDWDGSLTIDKNNGIILSTMMGAGKKNSDGTFSGVLLGDVAETADVGSKDGLGLYGYLGGVQSYGFNSDGTAFIGTPNTGRIEFNGISGTIYNSGYKSGSGIMINLGDSNHSPYIDLKQTIIKDGQKVPYGVKISAESPYFKITHKDDKKPIMYVSDTEYYLRSPNWEIKSNGEATFSKVHITNADGNNSSLDWGNNFKVGTNGHLHAEGATITGNITANSGTFHGRIEADSGYFKGRIEANEGSFTGSISGSNISGGTISGSRFTGGSISVNGKVTCSGLTIGGTGYDMKEALIPCYPAKGGASVVTDAKLIKDRTGKVVDINLTKTPLKDLLAHTTYHIKMLGVVLN